MTELKISKKKNIKGEHQAFFGIFLFFQMTSLQLYVWGSALNAPSIDPKCIVVESYLRLINQEYTIVRCNDPHMSPTGELPLLKDGAVWVAGVDRILTHLSNHKKDSNADLSPEQKANYLA